MFLNLVRLYIKKAILLSGSLMISVTGMGVKVKCVKVLVLNLL